MNTMPSMTKSCTRCGKEQIRHHNARKCCAAGCGGDLTARTDSTWIQTFTGRQFWPLEPAAEDVYLADIAHALAQKCRFTGHVQDFYSVAQHSVHVSRLVPAEHAAWGLMHDASEAYLPDVARPVKRQLQGFVEIEERVLLAIAERFRLPWPMPDCVHQADLIALRTERRDLMGPAPRPWRSTECVQPDEAPIVPMCPRIAELAFLEVFFKLGIHV